MNDALNQIQLHLSQLKQEGRFADAVPLQLQVLEAAQRDGHIKNISNAWNYLSMLYYRSGSHTEAEQASRESIAVYLNDPSPVDETMACYEMLLAQILASQKKFDAAVACGKTALKLYSTFHDPPDKFLAGIKKKVDLMIEYRDRQHHGE